MAVASEKPVIKNNKPVTQEPQVSTVVDLTKISSQEIRDIIRRKKAQEGLKELESHGVVDFKIAVAKEDSLEKLYTVAKAFTWRREQVMRVLHPSDGKRGRKPKTENK